MILIHPDRKKWLTCVIRYCRLVQSCAPLRSRKKAESRRCYSLDGVDMMEQMIPNHRTILLQTHPAGSPWLLPLRTCLHINCEHCFWLSWFPTFGSMQPCSINRINSPESKWRHRPPASDARTRSKLNKMIQKAVRAGIPSPSLLVGVAVILMR